MTTEQAVTTTFFLFHLSNFGLTEPTETLNVHPKDETEQNVILSLMDFWLNLKPFITHTVFAATPCYFLLQ